MNNNHIFLLNSDISVIVGFNVVDNMTKGWFELQGKNWNQFLFWVCIWGVWLVQETVHRRKSHFLILMRYEEYVGVIVDIQDSSTGTGLIG
jgi:hypothetical protein